MKKHLVITWKHVVTIRTHAAITRKLLVKPLGITRNHIVITRKLLVITIKAFCYNNKSMLLLQEKIPLLHLV